VTLVSPQVAFCSPDPDAEYAGGVHIIDLAQIRP